MNDENLIPINKRAKSVQREIRRKGGLTRAANARRRKEHQEKWRALLELVDEEGLSVLDKVDRALTARALKGDVNAYEKIMEYSGLSVLLDLKEEELKLKQDKLKLERSQLEQKAGDTADIEDLSALAEMINESDADDQLG